MRFGKTIGLAITTMALLSLSREVFCKKQKVTALRESSYPYISGDTFRDFCDFIVDHTKVPFNPLDVKEGDTIYIKTDFLDKFFKTLHPKIQYKYILVSHNSTIPVTKKYLKYLEDEKLAYWFGKNIIVKHPKLIQLPVGLSNSDWPHGKVDIISNIETKTYEEKEGLLYINFKPGTYKKERPAVLEYFKEKSFSTFVERKPWKEYLQDLTRFKFILSPRGYGLDCLRTWEALLMGSIPIVLSSELDPLLEDLPVVIVNDWHEVTEEFLNTTYEKIIHMQYNTEKIYAQYWFDKIKAAQREIRNH